MKPRILTVSKFLYRRGGAEIMALETRDQLAARGYESAEWGMSHRMNRDSAYSHLYAPEVVMSGTLANKVTGAARSLGYSSVKMRFKRMLDVFRPDVVHFHNIHSYLSPVVVGMAKDAGCRTVWTLHDYKLICPAYTCLREGKVCSDCRSDRRAVVKSRCMKGSVAASLAAYMEARKWNIRLLSRQTDMFICPSRFMAEMMTAAGIPEVKTSVLCNFTGNIGMEPDSRKGDYYAYFGRLSEEKGVATLLKSASALPYRLKIFGDGPVKEEMRQKYAGYKQIEFHGHADPATVAAEMAGAKLTVVPSEWYENNPLSVIESLCAGTPVAGSRIGGIPELIDEGWNGMLSEPGDAEALRRNIEMMITAPHIYDYREIARKARTRFSADNHIRQLEKIYNGGQVSG